MLRTIGKLLGENGRRIGLPIALLGADAVLGIVLYVVLYMTVVRLLDDALTAGDVVAYTGICLVSVIARLAIYRSAYYLCFARGAEMCGEMRLDLANHYRSLGLGYFSRESSGRLLGTLTKDLSDFELVVTHTLPSLVKTAVTAALVLVGMLLIDWRLALAECAVLLIAVPILSWGNRLAEKYGARKRDLAAKTVSIVLEYVKGMKVFKSHNMTSSRFSRMADALESIRAANVGAEVKMAAPTSMYSITANFLLPLVLLVGSCLLLEGAIEPERLVAFMLMSLALSALLISFGHSYNLLKELNPAVRNLDRAYDAKPLPCKEVGAGPSRFDVAFEHVGFSYDGQVDVLTDVSFFARENSVTALIGPSGSGKSTVANLIARFWDATRGTIRIGGKDTRDFDPDEFLRSVSAVFQENTLLSGTIYRNIKAGREDATEEEVVEAAKAACCHEFIESLPEGYQTRLSEGGTTLSGGERQRIAIARAILKNAPILLLDESTASLDADNEAKVNRALDRLMQGKTVFVIAHRLNTIQNADQIILLNRGRIEEMGTHAELLAKGGHYREMVREQERAKGWIVKGA